MKSATPEGTFRHELHGVRGLALSLVVLFHLFGNGRVSGGIDVFLAITGFLFTGSLLRRAVQGRGRISLTAHFGRLGQRLLPPILPVLAAVSVGAYLVIPQSRWVQVAEELKATILYFENWELISSQLDYDAAGAETSPLQHFWSLSVQGQFYLLAPLVVMAVVFAAQRFGLSPRRVLIGVLAATFVGSLAYSIHLTELNQPVAYFHTGTRMWEFALGGLAALLLGRLRISMRARVVAGWVGIGMIISCGLLFDGGRVFPGFLALWPVLGMIAVLAGGMTTSPWGVDRLLVTKPLTFVADISYSLYLWHWPILIFFLVITGNEQVGILAAAGILTLSVVLAWLSKRYVEDVVQRWRFVAQQRRKFLVVATSIAVVALTTGATASHLSNRQEQLLAQSLANEGSFVGASALLDPDGLFLDEYESGSVIPDPAVLSDDLPDIYGQGCIQKLPSEFTEVLSCTNDVEEPDRHIVLTGGSHVVQWWPALEEIAQERDWRLTLVTKNGCHFTTDRGDLGGPEMNEGCLQWNEAAMPLIVDLDPDAVFLLGSTTQGGAEHVSQGLVGAWEKLEREQIPVIAVRDTPRLDDDPVECFTRSGLDPVACGQPRLESLAEDSPFDDVEVMPGNVIPVDLTQLFCTEELCPAIVGDMIVMRDSHHVGATYMRSITPFLEMQLQDSAPELFTR